MFPSLSNFVERLDDQLWKAFQKLNHTDLEYLHRIQDENKLLFLIDKVLAFFKEFDQLEHAARSAIVKLTYVYYKNDSIYERIRSRLAAKGKATEAGSNDESTGVYFLANPREAIEDLCRTVFQYGTPR